MMSLSGARPIVLAPVVPAADDARGESNFTNLVARFPTSAVFALTTVNSAGGVESGCASGFEPGCAAGAGPGPAVTTVSSSGGVPRGGIGRGGGTCGGP